MPARHLCLFTLSLRVHACMLVCMHMSCAVKTNMRPLNWHVSRVGENTTIPCHPGSAYLYTTFLSCGHSFVSVLSSSCRFKYPLSRKWKLHTHRQNKNSSMALFPTPSQYAACKPQYCVIYLLLFSLYTNSCLSNHESQYFVKFSDDFSLLSKSSSRYPWSNFEWIYCLVRWRFRGMNARKTKEIVFVFRWNSQPSPASIFLDIEVEIVSTFTYLGTMFS